MLGSVFAILIGLLPALAQPGADVEYVLRQNGISCVRAPCPVVDVTAVATGQLTRVVDVDVAAVATNDAQRAELATGVRAGWFVVTGRIERRGEADIFVVSRILRRAPNAPPRAQLP